MRADRKRHPRLALQVPPQAPLGPLPRQVPPPVPRALSRPVPCARLPPEATVTLTAPCGVTRPETDTGPPPMYPTRPPLTMMPYRYDGSHGPLRVITVTLHGPSKDAAKATGAAKTALTANAAAAMALR